MIKDLSAFDIHALVKEFQILLDSKVVRVFMPSSEELIFQLYSSKQGKNLLRILLPKFIFISSTKPDSPQTPHGFCSFLRKHLNNAFVTEISQLNFERIISIRFRSKETTYTLIIELFSKGNIILCDEKGIILSPLKQQTWSSRTIKSKLPYSPPESRFNLFSFTKDDLRLLLSRSKKDSLVLALASGLGFGGILSEEVCFLAGIDKNLSPKNISDIDIENLTLAMSSLLKKKFSPKIIMDIKGDTLDITPFGFESYSSYKSKDVGSFNKALDLNISSLSTTKPKERSKAEKKREKVMIIIESQEERLNHLEEEARINTEKGEAIYNRYKEIDDILSQLKLARKTMSWQEIKEKIKSHKLIKEIHEDTGQLILEL